MPKEALTGGCDDAQAGLAEGEAVGDVDSGPEDGNGDEQAHEKREDAPSAVLRHIVDEPAHEQGRSHPDEAQSRGEA